MRKYILTLGLVLAGTGLFAQVKTKTFGVDLRMPDDSPLLVIQPSNEKEQLQVHFNELIVFKLLNPNPLRYNYSLNFEKVSFFETDANAVFPDSVNKATAQSDKDSLRKTQNDSLQWGEFERAKANIMILKDELEGLLVSSTDFLQESKNQKALEKDSYEDQVEEIKAYLEEIISEVNDVTAGVETNLVGPWAEEYNKLIEKEIDPLVEKIKSNLNSLNITKWEYGTLPIDVNGDNIDAVKFTVKRTPKEKESNEDGETSYDYFVWVTGGFKIDVSAGIFFTSLVNREYGTRDVLIDGGGEMPVTEKSIYEKNQGRLKYGLGSMLNVTYRSGRWIKPGLSIGAILSEEQQIEFLGGLGLALGKKSRVILHGGISLGNVTELSSDFETDGTSYDLGTEGEIPTIKKFKSGYFFGVTYNLGKFRTKEDDSTND